MGGILLIFFGFLDGGVSGVGAEDEGFGVVGEGELDAAGSGWFFGVGIGIWRRREFAGVLVGFFAGGEVADDDFTVAFKREEAVSEVSGRRGRVPGR